MKTLIYLADLTHRGVVLSSEVFPLSIGLIAAYLLKHRSDTVEIQLFKYPEDLSAAIEAQRPAIMGFANYSWNLNISYGYTKIIKSLWPDIAVVFGGPNYGLTDEEVKSFWQVYNLIDFHIVGEGEQAFLHLVDRLIAKGLDATSVKAERQPLSNCHFIDNGNVIKGLMLPRLTLADVPSPYLMGLMDKFFDEHLGPMIHTTRGCPFKCAFCTEGASYYNAVEQRYEGLREELRYIARRVCGPRNLFITDANFGMFIQDIDKAEIIAECQKEYGYPKYIYVSTGKNKKERVVEIAGMLHGALNLAASLQSTDPQVLKNVSRSNISLEKLMQVGSEANKSDTGTYTELILGLPGDSLVVHQQSLRDVVEANFDNIRMYQLIMLPQTELNTPDSRRKYQMRSMHRIMPRSFGRYQLAGYEFIAVESEEVLVENSTLPFDDYVTCREMDLTIEIIHNGKVYKELQGICKSYSLSWFDFIMRFFKKRRSYTEELRKIYDDFKASHFTRLWKTRQGLEASVIDNIDQLLNDDKGTNEMSTGKATAFFELFEQINDILYDELATWLEEQERLDDMNRHYLEECRRFSCLRKKNLMRYDLKFTECFCFDMQMLDNRDFCVSPQDAWRNVPKRYAVTHLSTQQEQISAYQREFGNSPDGLGKMLMRYPHIHRIFRQALPLS